MSATVEKLEHNKARITIEVPAKKFEDAVQNAYLKERSRILVPGFRRGKAPRKLIEQMYGSDFFYESAANELLDPAYWDAVEELKSELDVLSLPKISIVQAEVGEPFIFDAVVALRPEVKLGQYKGLPVPVQDVTVTEEEVDQNIEVIRHANSRLLTVEDRPSMEGDTLNISYKGYVDGVPFHGGEEDNHEFILGGDSPVPDFGAQLIGKETGSDVKVTVMLPEEYGPDLEGK